MASTTRRGRTSPTSSRRTAGRSRLSPGSEPPLGNPVDNERIWLPLWTALAASYGAGEWGAKYAAEQAWAKFMMDPITEDSAATIDAFIRGLVRS
jgi:hypothetical protein